MEEYTISKIAYDSLIGVLKTNPNFETIDLRKKWISAIDKNDKIIKLQDTLQFIYDLTPERQVPFFSDFQKRLGNTKQLHQDLFIDKSIKSIASYAVEENINAALLNNYNNSNNIDKQYTKTM